MGDQVSVSSLKYIILICVLLTACSQKKQQPSDSNVAKPVPKLSNDTFEMDNGLVKSLAKDFMVDTSDYGNGKRGYYLSIILPRLADESEKELEKTLRAEINRKLRKYLLRNGVVNMRKGADSVDISVELVNAYKSEKLVSYGFRTAFITVGAMRNYWEYFSVNYDIQQKKFLKLGDYFILNTRADSANVSSIIYGAVGEREYGQLTSRPFEVIDNRTDFSITAGNVYFYFDEFTLAGNPAGLEGSVKRKYIMNLVQPQYR